MGSSREDIFNRAKEMRKQEKEEQANRSSFSGLDNDGVVYTSLPSEGMKVFRILGDPLAVRSKPTDPKLSFISMILGDNGKKFRCIWPSKEEQPNWILWKIMDLVLDGEWEKDEEGKSKRVYKYASSKPECFRRVSKNNSDNKFEKGWFPNRFVNMNIIDRHDPDYHKETQHSKLISKKASEISDTGKFWYDPGIPEFAYNVIWDDVVEFAGQWDVYDICLKKEKDLPYYRAFHGYDDRKKIAQIDSKALELVKEGPLTEEEKAYKLYNLDERFRTTSYTKIKKNLGEFIKKVDIDFRKDFYKELEKLVEEERKVWEANKKNGIHQEEEDDGEEEHGLFEEDDIPTPAPSPAPTLKSRVVREAKATNPNDINWDALADGSYNGTKYLGVPLMTQDEKDMVTGVDSEGQFEYVSSWNGSSVETLNNPKSNFLSPSEFHVDPLSGDLF